MPNLKRGSKTYRNLKDAFGIESEASCRYLYFARYADNEGSLCAIRNVTLANPAVLYFSGTSTEPGATSADL